MYRYTSSQYRGTVKCYYYTKKTIAKYYSGIDYNVTLVSQNARIKFVRNIPSLRWFQSDLTQEDIDMFQKERPGIEL
jgi:hypothetical protein